MLKLREPNYVTPKERRRYDLLGKESDKHSDPILVFFITGGRWRWPMLSSASVCVCEGLYVWYTRLSVIVWVCWCVCVCVCVCVCLCVCVCVCLCVCVFICLQTKCNESLFGQQGVHCTDCLRVLNDLKPMHPWLYRNPQH